MTARSIPEQPTFVTASEREVWTKLVRQLPDGSIVLANLRVTDRHQDHEADLVALIPNSGVVVIEVKGSHVWIDGGQWLIERGQGPQVIDPVGQARDTQYTLRNYVKADPRWTRGSIR